ncbi:hypothetical protein BDFG_00067 [Blastomyces dermatitidis ATCC 26199]|nr:hypothetical protein BDFG_00067 [Blastomyces dermatitidis ATCC 26199]
MESVLPGALMTGFQGRGTKGTLIKSAPSPIPFLERNHFVFLPNNGFCFAGSARIPADGFTRPPDFQVLDGTADSHRSCSVRVTVTAGTITYWGGRVSPNLTQYTGTSFKKLSLGDFGDW